MKAEIAFKDGKILTMDYKTVLKDKVHPLFIFDDRFIVNMNEIKFINLLDE